MLKINTKTQILAHYKDDKLITKYLVSTAKNGLGETENSNCTPKGKHLICKKFGAGMPMGSVFVSRQATGEVYSENLAKEHPNRDWILSRILWLNGCEDFNKNSKKRFIYIHGTPDSKPIGVAQSQGCIRMRNQDIIALFNQVEIGEIVEIS